ncbi:glycosyltransferase, group 2 family protein [Desulfitobacterium hafniense DP7]|uniref:Glycosyltransferase, group 2 family protein n=1 Tax=Desulfitobacterium hafniense DP7 TaxID=537010 RepID=G9XUN7_DESHA|nr:glycosyltransferase family 2 protein [Desulfitobacterium hafniense]EHL04609.1 glycosyltransferase, group 2 family protein [Desulfitobacterium hafniense DP7]
MGEKVLIYTQAYNSERTLHRAVDSIIAQDFCGLQPEYILVNNGSIDGTPGIINEYGKRHDWIKPIHLGVNIPSVSALVGAVLCKYRTQGYYIHLDADDEYMPNFFRNAYYFLRKNSLDIAACGIAHVDTASGKTIKLRQTSGNMVMDRIDYAEQYYLYRRFFTERWAKIYRLSLVQEWYSETADSLRSISERDYEDTLGIVAKTNRIGVLAETLFRYYLSPGQDTKTFKRGYIPRMVHHIANIRKWLNQFGELNKLNEDYLATIYLSWCERAVETLLNTDLTNVEKLGYIRDMFALPETASVLRRENCDPQFRNLAARGEFLRRIERTVVELGGDSAEILYEFTPAGGRTI